VMSLKWNRMLSFSSILLPGRFSRLDAYRFASSQPKSAGSSAASTACCVIAPWTDGARHLNSLQIFLTGSSRVNSGRPDNPTPNLFAGQPAEKTVLAAGPIWPLGAREDLPSITHLK